MADMTAMADILNDDPADATDVQSNFQIIEAYINGSNLVRTDGTKAMAANLDMGGYQLTNVDASNLTPPGVIDDYAGNTVPTGWLLCDGSAVSRTTYSALFTAIGVLWGAGDGSTTFNLPDLDGAVTVGFGTAPFDTVGNTGGQADPSLVEHNHTINHDHGSTGNQSASHSHTINHGHSDTFATAAGGNHSHNVTVYSGATVGTSGPPYFPPNFNGGGSAQLSETSDQPTHTHSVTGSVTSHSGSSGTQSASHTHVVAAHTGDSGDAGTATVTNHNYPPYGVVKKIIKT